jgi:hypothetical protein
MASMYPWRDGHGDAGPIEEDECGYCGAPPMYQDPQWDEENEPAPGQCTRCGATGLYEDKPITGSKKEETHVGHTTTVHLTKPEAAAALAAVHTSQRITNVARVLVNAVALHNARGITNRAERENELIEAVGLLDNAGALTLTHLATALLAIPADDRLTLEGDDDATD